MSGNTNCIKAKRGRVHCTMFADEILGFADAEKEINRLYSLELLSNQIKSEGKQAKVLVVEKSKQILE